MQGKDDEINTTIGPCRPIKVNTSLWTGNFLPDKFLWSDNDLLACSRNHQVEPVSREIFLPSQLTRSKINLSIVNTTINKGYSTQFRTVFSISVGQT